MIGRDGEVEDAASLTRVLSVNEREREEMGRESPRITARHDAGETLDAFGDLYGRPRHLLPGVCEPSSRPKRGTPGFEKPKGLAK
ncbi:hypothetical protein GBA65_18220 [Rubrobacter marinus]|uniref:Uncharacterized protein n=1 Tax=Rubrobacter marinus TaxID=2653852 RepID=A0A6G8Q0X8_9ACTN|nr:hypothetical protein [Rubrobacter marinus]QIN80134.1 hypothetical protein GBA65_18220 [Rubrobacter marinus]